MKDIKKKIVLFILLVSGCCIGNAQKSNFLIENIDGIIEDASKEVETGKPYSLVLKQQDSLIYISIDSSELLVASICICAKDKVFVFHASAALGSIEFSKKEGQVYTRDNSFKWEMRDTDMSEESIEKRIEYFNSNGWIANTMGMGNIGQAEFLINRNRIGDEKVKIAYGLMHADEPDKISTPISYMKNGCGDLSLVSGDPKSEYSFLTDHWVYADLKNQILYKD